MQPKGCVLDTQPFGCRSPWMLARHVAQITCTRRWGARHRARARGARCMSRSRMTRASTGRRDCDRRLRRRLFRAGNPRVWLPCRVYPRGLLRGLSMSLRRSRREKAARHPNTKRRADHLGSPRARSDHMEPWKCRRPSSLRSGRSDFAGSNRHRLCSMESMRLEMRVQGTSSSSALARTLVVRRRVHPRPHPRSPRRWSCPCSIGCGR